MVVNRPPDDQPPPEDPIDGFSLDADQRQPTKTLAGWRRFVETPTTQIPPCWGVARRADPRRILEMQVATAVLAGAHDLEARAALGDR